MKRDRDRDRERDSEYWRAKELLKQFKQLKQFIDKSYDYKILDERCHRQQNDCICCICHRQQFQLNSFLTNLANRNYFRNFFSLFTLGKFINRYFMAGAELSSSDYSPLLTIKSKYLFSISTQLFSTLYHFEFVSISFYSTFSFYYTFPLLFPIILQCFYLI